MKIIPAIDIVDGKCVRLLQGDFNKKTIYHDTPAELAMEFEAAGATHLHVVDLDGARNGHPSNWQVIDAIARSTSLIIDAGGGVKSTDDVRRLLDIGVSQVNVGTTAVTDPALVKGWLDYFGASRIVLSADVRGEQLATRGWTTLEPVDIYSLLTEFADEGLEYVACTDVSRDGMMMGANLELYRKLRKQFPALNLLASGGVATVGDIGALQQVGVYGVIIGTALFRGELTLEDVISRRTW